VGRLQAVVVEGEDGLRLGVGGGEEKLHLHIALVEVYRANDGGDTALRGGTDPHVYAVSIAIARTIEIAIVEGVDGVGVARVRGALRTVYDEGGGGDQLVEG
jgi:hypothetical protein